MESRRNPYVGPTALHEGTSIYGRRSEIEELTDLIISARLVLLYSPSGAGKTSLIQAGLLNALRNELGFSVSFIKGFGGLQHDGNRYLENLYEVLEGVLPEGQRTYSPANPFSSLDEYLKYRPVVPAEGPQKSRGNTAIEVLTFEDPDDNLTVLQDPADVPAGHIFIFDQFEEIFTLDPYDRDAKAEFFRQVGQALKDRTRCALFSMREDHIAEFDDYLHFLPTQLKARYRLGLLDHNHAREAIEGPALEQGIKFEEGAANILVHELCKVRRQTAEGEIKEFLGNFVEPVQLQVICYRLWEHLYATGGQDRLSEPRHNDHDHQLNADDEIISREEVQELSVDRALEQFYDDKVMAAAMATATPEGSIRSWFERKLITPHGIRGQVLYEPKRSGSLPNETIALLENAHLIRREARGGSEWYELAHDRLITPIRTSNAAWSKPLAPLQRATLEWEIQERRPEIFLPPIDWVKALLWAWWNPLLTRQSELDFLKHSRRSLAWKQGFVLIFLVVFFIVSLPWILLYKKHEELKQNQELIKVTSDAYRTQIDATQRPVNQALISAAQLAKTYQNIRHEKVKDRLTSTILETMYVTLRNATDIRRFIIGNNAVARAIAFNPSSQNEPIFAYTGGEGTIIIAGADSGILKTLNDVCKKKPDDWRTVSSLTFSGNGNLLAIGCWNGDVVIWNTNSGQPISAWHEASRWFAHTNGTLAVAFNRDGSEIASGGPKREIKLMEVSGDGKKISENPASLSLDKQNKPDAFISSLAFSPTENKLIAGDSKEFIWACDTNTNECLPTKIKRSAEEANGTNTVAFTGDGEHIVTGHVSGKLLMWDVKNTITNPQSLLADPRPSQIYSISIFNKSGEDEKPKIPYVAYGADGLRLTTLNPIHLQPRLTWQRPIFNREDVLATSLHEPSGLLAAITRNGNVILTETKRSLNHVATRNSLTDMQGNTCTDTTELLTVSNRGAIIGFDKVLKTAISYCGNLQIIGLDTNAHDKPVAQHTISAAKVRQGRIESIVSSTTANRIATLGENHTVKFWRLDTKLMEDETIRPMDASDFKAANFDVKMLQQIFLSPNGNWLAVTFRNSGRIFLAKLQANGKHHVETVITSFDDIRMLTFSADSKMFAVAGSLPQLPKQTSEQIELWSVDDAISVHKHGSMALPSFTGEARDIVLTANSHGRQLLAVGTNQGQVVTGDTKSGQKISVLQSGSNAAIYRIASSPSEHILVAADVQGKITLWNTITWEQMVLTGRFDELHRPELFEFSPDGKNLVSASNEFIVWDLNIDSLHRKICGILGKKQPKISSGMPEVRLRELDDACS